MRIPSRHSPIPQWTDVWHHWATRADPTRPSRSAHSSKLKPTCGPASSRTQASHLWIEDAAATRSPPTSCRNNAMTTLKVFCARSMTQAVNRIAGDFMRESGHRGDMTFGPVGTLQAKLAAGETADMLVLGAPAMAVMEKEGCFVAGTRTDVARVCIGVAVREGVPPPDISTAEAFRAALLAAGAVAFTDAAVGGTAAVYLPQLFKRMGIANEVARKAKP